MAKVFVGVRIEPDILIRLDKMASETGRDRSRLMSEAIALLVGAEVEATGDRLDRMQVQLNRLDGQVVELLARLSSLGKPQGRNPAKGMPMVG